MTAFKNLTAICVLFHLFAASSSAQTLGLKKEAPVPLSRAELRQCMDREDALQLRSAGLARAREEHDADMARISKSAAALAETLRQLDNYDQAAVDAYNERSRQHDAAVAALNKRTDAMNEAVGQLNADNADVMAQCNTRPYMRPDKDAILKERKKDGSRGNEKAGDKDDNKAKPGTRI
jgi:hypothetical protein